MIELVGFDGDDTLWHSEVYYQRAHADFEGVLGDALADVIGSTCMMIPPEG